MERVAGIEPASSAWKAEVLPLNHTRVPLSQRFVVTQKIRYRKLWWWEKDSNLRRHSRQIYSLIPLTAREPHQIFSRCYALFYGFFNTAALTFLSLPAPGSVLPQSAFAIVEQGRTAAFHRVLLPHFLGTSVTYIMVPPQGVEPWTFSLQVSCSTS